MRAKKMLGPVLAALLAGASAAAAGPWSQLPDAVSRLQERPGDRDALAVLEVAERALLGEAAAGHLASVAALLDAYAELVAPLSGSDRRLGVLQRRTAQVLLARGEGLYPLDVTGAGMTWSLAAGITPDPELLDRLRLLLLPPAAARPGQVWTSPVDGAEMVWLPDFRFLMGCTHGDGGCEPDEIYLRWVEVAGLWVQRHEVTNDQYRLCVDAGMCLPPEDRVLFDDGDRGREPVVGVDWYQAQDFAMWVGRRLPTEAEWEAAARGKMTDWRFPWGHYKSSDRANVLGTEGEDVFVAAAPVASFRWTGWGLYDIAGNIREWCEDTYHQNLSAAARDGSAYTDGGTGRVVRGGSWRQEIEWARVSARGWHEEDYRTADLGFRCVADDADLVADSAVVLMGRQAFPLNVEPGHELDAADLDATDRRYLERRALTWLVLEGRVWEALPRAVVLLGRDPDDRVAQDLLESIEGELTTGAVSGNVRELEQALERYRSVVTRSGLLAGRVSRLDRSLARSLKRAGEDLVRRGDSAGAGRCFGLALDLQPDSRDLQRLVDSLVPEPGTRMVWQIDGREMVWIPSGSFQMGRVRGDQEAGSDEQPSRTVHVQGFWIDRTEVTNSSYRRCVEAGACEPPHRQDRFLDPDYDHHPVISVDWHQARAYARWAGKRLPSESEWEHAARATTATLYPWGGDWVDGAANAIAAKGPDNWAGTAPVGSFPANRWGLLDLIGNAWEWVEDVYHPDFRGAPRDSRPWLGAADPEAERQKVLRGGSFMDFAPSLRSSQRDHREAGEWSRSTGFRCAADR